MSNTSAAANRILFSDNTNKGAIGSSGSAFKFRKGILKATGGEGGGSSN